MTENTPILDVQNVCKAFGTKVVHRQLSLQVKPGEVLTLVGGSGSGKSVLLRQMIGLEKPDSGSILFHGVDVTQLSERELVPFRKKIAYVFQFGALFDSLSIGENLAYPLLEHTDLSAEQIHARVMEMLLHFGLAGTESLFPDDLSGGMQRRVGLARSIILRPEVILYDEPTTGLDPFNTRMILKTILELKKEGATSILVSHDMQSVFSTSDRIAYLRDGQIEVIAPTEEFRATLNQHALAFVRGESPDAPDLNKGR